MKQQLFYFYDSGFFYYHAHIDGLNIGEFSNIFPCENIYLLDCIGGLRILLSSLKLSQYRIPPKGDLRSLLKMTHCNSNHLSAFPPPQWEISH